MGRRRRARECALQMLFQLDLTRAAPEAVFRQFWSPQERDDDLRRFAERLVLGTARRREDLDEVVAVSAQHWRIERMAVVDRNVLRMAVFEMIWEADTPPIVIIDEAVEVAKKFGSEESGGFINGILDHVRRRLERGELQRRADPRA